MTAVYWIAKYVEDPFRNEPRNVGVIVEFENKIAAKFIGERDDGSLDRRKLAKFSYPEVYAQWHDYWRKEITNGKVDEIIKAATSNYYVEASGEVSDIKGDGVSDVCLFLYDMLVGGGPAEAYKWEEDADLEISLSSDIVQALEKMGILLDHSKSSVRHPVVKDQQINGQHVVHVPSFSQKNGILNIYEHIDFTGKQTKIKERAGWMGYMFSDIKEHDKDAKSYSIIRPGNAGADGAIEYAKSVLASESMIVNWSDENERQAFLNERIKIADAV